MCLESVWGLVECQIVFWVADVGRDKKVRKAERARRINVEASAQQEAACTLPASTLTPKRKPQQIEVAPCTKWVTKKDAVQSNRSSGLLFLLPVSFPSFLVLPYSAYSL